MSPSPASPAAPAAPPPAEGLRERNKRRRAAQILAAARELLREDAGRIPTVDRIAERASVSPATVFNLVGTRERIWAALADETLAAITVPDPPEDPRAHALALADRIVGELCADAPVFRAVLSQWTQSGRLLRSDATAAITDCLDRAPGRRAEADVRRLSDLIATGCTGAAHMWAAGMIGDAGFRERCRGFVELAFDAAGVPSAPAPAPARSRR